MNKKIIKYVLSGIATILLGALGSACWEIALRPFFHFILEQIMHLYGTLSDQIYFSIARAGNLMTSFAARFFIVFLMLFFLYGISLSRRIITLFFSKPSIGGMLIFAVFAFSMLTRTYYDTTANETLRNIEIVSPYISDQEYKQLKSDFYSMNAKSDYDELCNTINSIMESNDLK